MTNRPLIVSKFLIDKMSLGDRDAFRIFYDMVYPVVYHFIHYFLPTKNDCEEVVSEVFYIVWKQRKGLGAINDLKSWLFIVSRNEVYRYVKQKKQFSNISIDDLPVELSVDVSVVDNGLIENEMMDVYNKAVAELPERCKLIFLMVREQQLKYKEIAQILSISEGTIEKQMNIAIRKIVSIVRKYYPFIEKP